MGKADKGTHNFTGVGNSLHTTQNIAKCCPTANLWQSVKMRRLNSLLLMRGLVLSIPSVQEGRRKWWLILSVA